ncbi:MAG: CvpA family protein [Dehalococcoidia bacterium]
MDWVSVVLLAFVGFLTWRAFRNGLIREVVAFAAVVLGVPIAGLFYDDMVPKVEPITDNSTIAALIAFLAIWGGVVAGGQIGAYLLRDLVRLLNLGMLDHAAGAVFGFAKGVLIAQVVLVALVVFPKPNLQRSINDSEVATELLDWAPLVLGVLPSRFDDAVDLFLRPALALDEQIDDEAP